MKSSNPLSGKGNIKVLLIRPPGYMWPIINESDNFLLPLGLPCIAAYLRDNMEGVEPQILDCCPERIGWKSLRRRIEEIKPDVVGVGDMICYAAEGMRTVKMAKEINPDIVTVAGGHFHSHMPEYSLENYSSLDYIVRWEGEEAFRRLIDTLRGDGNLNKVGSLAFRNGDDVVQTEPLPLIDPLDDLPIPAYDLTRLDLYSPFGKLWPRAATIQGNRGCPYKCRFCSWAALEGQHYLTDDGEIGLQPTFRTKSLDRVMEEIDLLYNKYNVRYLFWAEGTWNYDTDFMEQLSDAILSRGYKLGWWAFVRPDKLMEQEQAGVLEKMVKAGLTHTLMGGERHEDEDLDLIGKTGSSFDVLKECCHLLERKYPSVFRQATFVTGIPNDTKEKLMNLGKYVRSLHLDFAAFHPMMPYPGTSLWEDLKDTSLIETRDFSKYDMFTPVLRTSDLSREEVAKYTEKITLDFVQKQPHRYIMGLFSRIRIRRRLHWWFLFSMFRVVMLDLWHAVTRRRTFRGFSATSELWKPTWYDN